MNDRQTRLLVVSNYFPPQSIGGAEIVALRQAKAMRGRGWDVSVFAADFSSASRREGRVTREDTDGLPVFRARINPRDGRGYLNPTAERPFARVLRDVSPDVVHFHNLSLLGLGLVGLAEAAGAKIVVTLHDRWAICFKGTLLRNDLSLCEDFDACAACSPTLRTPHGALPPRLRQDYALTQLARAQTLIAPSQKLADDFLRAGADPGRLEVVSSGIDLLSIPPRLREPDGVIRFACAAYLDEHKGIRVLTEALRMLWSDEALRGRWRFLIAGDGPLAPMLRDGLRAEGLKDAVETPGRLPHEEVLRRLSEADVAVLPSICVENQPVWLLEGLASGAALVASRVGGNAELVEHGVNGLLYSRLDPGALAAALRELIVSPERIAAYSRENLLRRDRYDERTVGPALERLYRSEKRAATSADLIVACGLNRTRAAAAIERAPHHAHGRRIRLIWWRWVKSLGPVGAKPWIYSLGWRWKDWLQGLIVFGPGPLLRRARTRRAPPQSCPSPAASPAEQ